MSAPQPGRILRLVKSGPERRALESGEVDAVLDPATGTAMLLPDAQRERDPDHAFAADQAHFQGLALLHDHEQGHVGVAGKVHMPDALAGLI